jgi:hypothetical protein
MPDRNPETKEFNDRLDVPEIDFVIHEPGMWSFIIGEAVGFSPDKDSKSQSSKKLQELFAEKPVAPEILEGLRSGIGKYGENLLRFTFAALASEKGKAYKKEAKVFCDSFKSFREQYPEVKKIVVPEFENARDKMDSKRGEYIEQMQTIIDFFRPKRATADVRKVLVVASGEMLSSVGTVYNMDEEVITIFAGSDVETAGHEFMHCLINPVVEKINFSEAEAGRIKDLVVLYIRVFCNDATEYMEESLINSYLRSYSKGKSVREILLGIYDNIDQLTFTRELKRSKYFSETMRALGVKSYSDWTDKKKEELYERYFQGGLMERCVDFYKEYEVAKRGEPFLTFEDFFLQNYKELLK